VFDLVQAVGLLLFEMVRYGKKQVVPVLVLERHALGPVIQFPYTASVEQDDTSGVNIFTDRYEVISGFQMARQDLSPGYKRLVDALI
jgi:hypothetical protein